MKNRAAFAPTRRGQILLTILVLATLPLFSQVPKWKELEALGDTLYHREDFEGALGYYDKAIKESKLKEREAYGALYKRAVCYYSTGAYDNALKDIDTFLAELPQVPQPKLLRAFIYRELNDSDKQLAALEEVIRSQAPDPGLLKWRGMLYLQKDKFKEAKRDIVAARNLEDDAETETYLGLCYYNLEQKDSAFVCFNKSIELDATYTPAYLYAGSISLEDDNYDRCLEYISLALRLDPKNKEALFYKGIALIEKKRIDEGCTCLNRAFYAGFDDAGDYLKQYCFGEN